MEWKELEEKINDLTDKEAYKTLLFLYWRAYENDSKEFQINLEKAIEYVKNRR